jgi:hypothetical protein
MRRIKISKYFMIQWFRIQFLAAPSKIAISREQNPAVEKRPESLLRRHSP